MAMWCGLAAVITLGISFFFAASTMTKGDAEPVNHVTELTTVSDSQEQAATPADPAAQPQTPPPSIIDPAINAVPQNVQAGADSNPASTASPQSLQESKKPE